MIIHFLSKIEVKLGNEPHLPASKMCTADYKTSTFLCCSYFARYSTSWLFRPPVNKNISNYIPKNFTFTLIVALSLLLNFRLQAVFHLSSRFMRPKELFPICTSHTQIGLSFDLVLLTKASQQPYFDPKNKICLATCFYW